MYAMQAFRLLSIALAVLVTGTCVASGNVAEVAGTS